MTPRGINMGRVLTALAALTLASCLSDEPPRAEAPGDPNDCARGGTACPALAGHEVSCSARSCVARAPSGELRGDCDGSGRYGTPLDHSDEHCGACGRHCDGALRCVDGSCVSEGCGGADVRCGASCVDLQSNPRHCGGCGVACEGDAPCVAGRCAPCPAGMRYCVGRCADLTRDVENCGACARWCARNQACEGGRCVVPCAPGQTRCGTACVDLLADAENCGACRHTCPYTVRCEDGACACPARQTECAGRCVELASDRSHCGACGNTCQFGFICVGGACQCPPGQTRCGDTCADIARDRDHCGGCDRRCPLDTVCLAGACARCPAGTLRCGDSCATVDSDREHCGTCGNQCWSAACDRGRCQWGCEVSLLGDTGRAGYFATNDDHCGACGVRCAAGDVCVGARCLRAAPRLAAPISTSVVTSARPWLRWKLAPGAEGARVELCDTRSCARVEHRWDVAGEALRVPEALRAGVHFWRALERRGGAVIDAPGVVWEFVVPERPGAASAPPGFRIDFNGDGLADRFTLDTPPDASHALTRRLQVFLGTTGAPSATPDRVFILPGSTVYTVTDGRLDYGPAFSPVYASDLNGDGFGDLVLSFDHPMGRYRIPEVSARLFLGGPDGVLAAGQYLSTGWQALGLRSFWHAPVGDVDGDGYGDLTGTDRGIRLYGGRAVAFSSRTQFSACATEVPHLAGDFNADGASEIVSATCVPGGSPEPAVMVRPSFPGAWEASLAPYALYGCGVSRVDPARWADAVRVADDDLDGFDDLVLWTGRTATEHAVFRGGADGLVSGRCALVP